MQSLSQPRRLGVSIPLCYDVITCSFLSGEEIPLSSPETQAVLVQESIKRPTHRTLKFGGNGKPGSCCAPEEIPCGVSVSSLLPPRSNSYLEFSNESPWFGYSLLKFLGNVSVCSSFISSSRLVGFLVYVNRGLSALGQFLPAVAAQLRKRTNDYSELPGRTLLFALDKNIQEVLQLFQHSYTGISL